ncbi:MAG: hypothetical protein Ct9H300mP23_03070 [Nitrospinota bacterium]|nr:MAG: hypothetical protein Ct9H300mP23_03070 [Nitrospinota bacterium]
MVHRNQTNNCYADTPFFPTSVGIGYSVHLLVYTTVPARPRRQRGGDCFCNGPFGSGDSYHQPTTAGGLLSFVPVEVARFQIWLFGAAGVLLAFSSHGPLTSPLSVLPEGKPLVVEEN